MQLFSCPLTVGSISVWHKFNHSKPQQQLLQCPWRAVSCCAFSLSNSRLQWLYPASLLVLLHRHDVSTRPVSAFIDLLDPLALAIHKGQQGGG